MRLRKLKLKNFRGYRNSTEIIIDESMTGIVGRNDFGKSTLLEALAIFFETEGMKADKNDMNCFSLREGDGRFEIACEFDDLPDFIMIDDRVQTTLASEHLLNEDGNFEIVKTFKATTSGKPEQTCIRCIHPDEEPLRNLLGMKISELKAVGKEVEKMWRINALHRYGVRPSGKPQPPIPVRKLCWMSIKSSEPTQNHYGVRSSICCPRMRFSKPTGKAATGIPKLKTPYSRP